MVAVELVDVMTFSISANHRTPTAFDADIYAQEVQFRSSPNLRPPSDMTVNEFLGRWLVVRGLNRWVRAPLKVTVVA